MRTCYLRSTRQGIAVYTPYDAAFVATLKQQIPAADRRWQKDDKAWVIAAQHGDLVAQLIEEHFGQDVDVPTVRAAQPEQRMLRLEYLGQAKDRGDGTMSAFGWVDDGWNAVFPLDVLQNWFCVDSKPTERPTLYGTLGVPPGATPEEIKKAFRRLALQWHPDTCKEPDAAAQFRALREAYDVLADSQQRRRYNAGLQLASMTKRTDSDIMNYVSAWRAPLRCGWLLVQGTPQVGRFVVSRITQWHDITENGRTMSVSWPRGADTFEVRWV